MNLSSRLAAPEDFAPFFNACYHDACHDQGLRQGIEHEWRFLMKSPATLTLVVEDPARLPDRRLVGCAQLVFLTPTFVRLARKAPIPWINSQVCRPLPDGSSALLSPAQIARANASTGLYALFTRWHRADWLLSPAEMLETNLFMHAAFQAYARGYRFRDILIEATGDLARDKGVRAGFYLRCDYADYYESHPPLPPPSWHPFLLGITRAEAVAAEGSAMSHYFVHRPPRLRLTPGQQEVLGLWLRHPDFSEGALADALGVPVFRIKNLLRAAYGRISVVAPDLLPEMGDGKRGQEKRRRLLQFLHEHPEELRPYQHRQSAED